MSKRTQFEKILLQFLLKYEKMTKRERKVLIDTIMIMTHPVIEIKNDFNLPPQHKE